MKKLCDRCGSASLSMISQGGAMLCPTCHTDTQPDIETLRDAGKPVNVLQIARAHFKANFSAGRYNLLDIPADLKQQWEQRAVQDRCNKRDVLLAALSEYLNPA